MDHGQRDSRGGHDEHELATELTMAERRVKVQPPHQDGHPALGAALRHLQDQAAPRGRVQQQAPYSSTPTAGTLQQKHPRDPTAAGTCRPLLPPSRQSHAPRHCCLNRCSPTSTSSFVKLPIHNCAAGDPALEFMIKYATKQEPAQDAAFSRNEVSRSCISGVPLRAVVTGLWTSHPDSPV